VAHSCVDVAADPDRVFDVLVDPRTYPAWLIGADHVRAVDAGWPTPGSRFHHTVGVWPLHVHDRSEVLEVERPRRLRLAVRATAMVRAVVTITLRGDATGTTICLEEEPAVPVIGEVVRPVLDPLTHVRNHASLRRLARLLEADNPSP
jgi:uncharacterized protein YndB with AHSA1/START domain